MPQAESGESASSSGATKTRETATPNKTKTARTQKNGSSNAKKSRSAARPADATELLKADHRKVEKLFASYEGAESLAQKSDLARQICSELIVHTALEEEIFYPACRQATGEGKPIDEAQVEHDSAKALIAELLNGSPEDPFYDAKVRVLSEHIKHHVAEEEKARSGIFAKAKKAGLNAVALGEQILARKQELMNELTRGEPLPPQPVSFRAQPQAASRRSNQQEETSMARFGNQGRDERGRFTDDDDYDERRRGRMQAESRGQRGRERDEEGRFTSGGREQSRYDDEDDDRGRGRMQSSGRGSGSNRERDEDGRFASGGRGSRDDDRRSTRDDDDDDDDRGGRGRSRGGWFGDSEGHSQAARRGGQSQNPRRDDDRRDEDGRFASGGRGSSREDDRRGYRDEDEDDRGGRGQGRSRASSTRGERTSGGWFGDPEGHSEASRRGWERSDHEGSGWYGDSEGHSQAARRGAQSRRRDDDDDRRGDRGGGGRGRSGSNQGGWFGDSEGHSEAARRGWEDRR